MLQIHIHALCMYYHRDRVPIATQFFAINEKWVLMKFMKALGTFCV